MFEDSPTISQRKIRSVSIDENNSLTDESNELKEMTRSLRRAKRRLLLEAAKRPSAPVEQLREILFQFSFDDGDTSSPSSSFGSLPPNKP
jgi:hypothetical protein